MKTYGIKKTIIRFTVKLPDNTARIQRLYDYGAWFSLEEELLTSVEDVLNFMEKMVARGAKRIDQNEFVDKRIAGKDVSGYYLVKNGEFAYNKSTSSDAPWGAVTIAEFADDGYQTDSESHASAVTVNYDGVAEQYVDVPDDFLAQLNMLTPGDEVSGEIAISNKSNEEHELWVDVDVSDAALGSALTVRIAKDDAVLYEGSLADLAETSLGKLAPGDAGTISVSLSLPAETGNDIGSIQSAISWKFRVDATEEQPIPVGPQTEDNITAAMIIFLASFGGLILLSLFERREQNEEE